jgi:diamine N-acetyltransferase
LSDPLRLIEITAATLRPVLGLAVAADQTAFVASNAVSIAEAHFEPGAWFRCIAAGAEPGGFAMVFDPTLPGAEPGPDWDARTLVLWRFMIDHRFQRHGFGRGAIALLAAHARSRPGIARFATTYVEGPGGPAAFYLRLGFRPTGRLVDGEAEAVMALTSA